MRKGSVRLDEALVVLNFELVCAVGKLCGEKTAMRWVSEAVQPPVREHHLICHNNTITDWPTQ